MSHQDIKDILEAKVKELKQEYAKEEGLLLQGEILLNYIEAQLWSHLEYKLQGQSTFNMTIGVLNVWLSCEKSL